MNLPSDKVIFLLSRKYKLAYDCDFVSVDLTCFSDNFSQINLKKALNFCKNTKYMDGFLDNILNGKEFIAYVPQVSSLFFQLIITNKHCKGYHFIEEGIANYRGNLYLKSTKKSSSIIRFIYDLVNKCSKRFMLYPACLGSYPKVEYNPKYYLFKKKSFLSNDKIECIEFLPNKINDEIFNFDVAIVFSASVESSILALVDFKVIMCKYIEYCKLNGLAKIGLKFHPMQSEVMKDFICKEFSKENYSIIEDEVDVERLVRFNDTLVILGLESSVLLYAKVFGKNNIVVSFISFYNKSLRKEKVYNGYNEVEEIFKDNGIVLI
ncbi:polysialyltransferase family glycosyltransferase [Myroides marinus]|uniref:polysialyltransferase family glycosyltransferase n=1 Tax=Myroides marinus TaxID=703342 RepID=UPI002581E3E3|nr:hypothetical protein [Myroides marinus]